MRDLTPAALKCSPITCPAVYQRDDGKLIIIGARAEPDDISGLEARGSRVGYDEYAIVVEPALLANVCQISNPSAPDNPYEPIDGNYRQPKVSDILG
jgi:hypothetical protein